MVKMNALIGAALLGATLSLTSCGEVGRYQMVVTSPYDGDDTDYSPAICVLDTKTGEVFYRHTHWQEMVSWDPLNKTYQSDSLIVTPSR